MLSHYVFHPLKYERQGDFLRSLIPLLKENGKNLIGDIAFDTQSDLIASQKRFPRDWDVEEFYPILTKIQTQLPELQVKHGDLVLRQRHPGLHAWVNGCKWSHQ